MQVLIRAKPDFDAEGELKVLESAPGSAESGHRQGAGPAGQPGLPCPGTLAEVVDKDTQKAEDLTAEAQLIDSFLKGQGSI